MKCKECICSKKGWFESKPYAYVCTGVKEPFIIEDINEECTEYVDLRNKKVPTEDCLIVGFDNGTYHGDNAVLSIMRVNGNGVVGVKALYDEEAFEVYKKLTCTL